MDKKYEPLFTPWKIGNVEIKNRIVMSETWKSKTELLCVLWAELRFSVGWNPIISTK